MGYTLLRKIRTALRLAINGQLLSYLKQRSQDHNVQVWIVSFPKCGRTWLEVMLGKAICLKHGQPDSRVFAMKKLSVEAGLLKTFFTHDESDVSLARRYDELDSRKSKYKGRKVVLLKRDYRDALVSNYFQATKRRNVFDGTISEFVRDDRFGIKKIVAFYRHWENAKDTSSDFLEVSYEDMHRDAEGCLRAVLGFMGGSDFSEQIIHEAANFARFDNLKNLEKSDYFDTDKLRPGDPNDPESFKVRKGQVKGYVNYLSEQDLKYIDGVLHGAEKI